MLALRRNAHQIGGGHGVARLGNAQHAAATYAALTWQGPCACILCFCVFTRVGDRLGALRPVTFSWWGAMSTVRARTSLRSHATARRTRKAPRDRRCAGRRPVGLMDKASAPGAPDSRFESWAGHVASLRRLFLSRRGWSQPEAKRKEKPWRGTRVLGCPPSALHFWLSFADRRGASFGGNSVCLVRRAPLCNKAPRTSSSIRRRQRLWASVGWVGAMVRCAHLVSAWKRRRGTRCAACGVQVQRAERLTFRSGAGSGGFTSGLVV